MPADHSNLRDIGLTQLDLVAKHPPAQIAVGKDAMLQRQETAGAVADMDDRQPVLQRDIQKAHDLFHGMRIPGTALDAGVIGMNSDLAALHDANARNHGGTRHCSVIFATGCEGGEFQKRCAGVQQQF